LIDRHSDGAYAVSFCHRGARDARASTPLAFLRFRPPTRGLLRWRTPATRRLVFSANQPVQRVEGRRRIVANAARLARRRVAHLDRDRDVLFLVALLLPESCGQSGRCGPRLATLRSAPGV
jgi:hypothetical protein